MSLLDRDNSVRICTPIAAIEHALRPRARAWRLQSLFVVAVLLVLPARLPGAAAVGLVCLLVVLVARGGGCVAVLAA